MKRFIMRLPAVATMMLLAIAVFALGACAGDTTTVPTTAAPTTAAPTTAAPTTAAPTTAAPTTTGATIPVTGVVLDEDEVTLEEGESITLVATIVPANATNKQIVWTSDDEEVATVNQSGVVTAVAGGAGASATITATTSDGNKTATCGIIVIEPKGEPMTFTAENGSFDAVLTLYPLGFIELTGGAVAGATELAIEDFSGMFTVTENVLTIQGNLHTVMFGSALPFPVLNEMSFVDQTLVLRLFVNNGTSDFELGTFTLTKEQAASIGVDTTVASVLVTASNVLGDSVALWTDGKAVVNAISMTAIVGAVSYETTWAQEGDVITVAMEEAVTTNFGPFNMHCFVEIVGTGIQFAVTADNTGGGDPHNGLVLATVMISRELALSKLGIDVPYIAVTAVAWDDENITERTNPEDPEDKFMAIDLLSGTTLDLSTVAAFTPLDATATAFETVVSSDEKVVRVKDNVIKTVLAGTAVITATVDDIEIKLTVIVTYPDNTYVDPVAFDEVTRFEYEVSAAGFDLMFVYEFYTNGMCYYTQYANGAVFEYSMGYYNVTKTADVVTGLNITLFLLEEEQVVTVTIAAGGMSFVLDETSTFTQVLFEGAFAQQETFHGEIDYSMFGLGIFGFNIVFNTDGTLVYSTTFSGFPLGSINGIYGLNEEALSIQLDAPAVDITGEFTVTTAGGIKSIILNQLLTVTNQPIE